MVEGLRLGDFWVGSPGVGSNDGAYNEGSSADRLFGSSGKLVSKSLEKDDQKCGRSALDTQVLGLRPGLG